MQDRLLALALTTHEDGLCGGCGQPRDRSWNADMEGEYDAHRVTCQGCQKIALETDGQPRKAAETIWVTDGTPDGYEPDPRMFPDLSSSTPARAEVLPDPVGEGA